MWKTMPHHFATWRSVQVGRWMRKSAIAGLCGSVTHFFLMFAKAKLGILPAFQPYESLQAALSLWTGFHVDQTVPWLISFLNGSTLAGFTFGRLYQHLPGKGGAVRGVIAGVLGWLAMNLFFFPLLGLGLFATQIGSGVWPAVFSLAMMLTYSVVMGIVYDMINPSADGSSEAEY